MEKSFSRFTHYPTWEPDASGREMLADSRSSETRTRRRRVRRRTRRRRRRRARRPDRRRRRAYSPRPALRVCFSTTRLAAIAAAAAEGTSRATRASAVALPVSSATDARRRSPTPPPSPSQRRTTRTRARTSGASRRVRCSGRDSTSPTSARGVGRGAATELAETMVTSTGGWRAFAGNPSQRAGRFRFRERRRDSREGIERAGERSNGDGDVHFAVVESVVDESRGVSGSGGVARRARGLARAGTGELAGKRRRRTVRERRRARTLSNETSCTAVDYEKRRRLSSLTTPRAPWT